jgi:hypothetical protein
MNYNLSIFRLGSLKVLPKLERLAHKSVTVVGYANHGNQANDH